MEKSLNHKHQKSDPPHSENVSDAVLQELDAYVHKQTIPLKYIEILKQFYLGYRDALHVHGVQVSACKD